MFRMSIITQNLNGSTREGNYKRSTAARLASDVNGPVQAANDVLHHCEPESVFPTSS
jgi:hypothetical protein